MSVLDTIKARHCKRAFLNMPVARDTIERVLSAAGNAASSKNTQPWQVIAVDGKKLDQLRDTLLAKHDAGEFDGLDYQYTLDPEPHAFKERAKDCGYKLFELKGIARDDRDARKAHGRLNWEFFGAPSALFFFLPAGAERGNFLDMGQFLQNVMLGLTSEGLGSCPQVSIAAHGKTIRAHLGVNEEQWLVCGLSVGVPDEHAIVNTYIPERLPLTDYFNWSTL